MKKGIITLVLSLLTFIGWASVSANMDSVGVTEINGIKYILHKVMPKETLYGLSKKYAVSIEQINKVNNLETGLKDGDLIRIPMNAELAKLPNSNPGMEAPKKQNTYTVKKGETLFAIAKKHKITVNDLKAWNNLKDNNTKEGMVLMVSAPNAVTPSPETKPTTTTVIKNGKKVVEPAVIPSGNKEMKEDIMAGVDESGILSSFRKFAMHPTLAPGTIIKVLNPENGRLVFVKVVEKLAQTEDNKSLGLIISKSAAEQISATGNQFKVNISYGVN